MKNKKRGVISRVDYHVIEFVKSNPILHTDLKFVDSEEDRKKVRKMWQEKARALRSPVCYIIKRWKAIREAYVKYYIKHVIEQKSDVRFYYVACPSELAFLDSFAIAKWKRTKGALLCEERECECPMSEPVPRRQNAELSERISSGQKFLPIDASVGDIKQKEPDRLSTLPEHVSREHNILPVNLNSSDIHQNKPDNVVVLVEPTSSNQNDGLTSINSNGVIQSNHGKECLLSKEISITENTPSGGTTHNNLIAPVLPEWTSRQCGGVTDTNEII